MCVIFFYANSNPSSDGYKLILASNRDEFFARETRSVAKWANADHVYGGIDLEPGREGGTWLAIGGKNGIFKVGALLNLTGEPKPRDAVGRGMIVADYVTSSDESHNIVNYNKGLIADCTKYSAFNFVSIEIGNASQPAAIKLLSNVPPTLADYEQERCYGFGNSLPEAPFEKVRHGQKHFAQIVEDHGHADVKTLSDQLLQLLKNSNKFWPDAELLKRAPNWGEGLSALNVHIAEHAYGSRTHTVLLLDANNKLHFIEETMAGLDPAGEWRRTHIEKQYTL
ncbi:transport and Golgi organization protein 2 isoform X2 [Scaptodrosophila lebanonensis]|uniref:Transport and Golgi organization protein 2 isoform X2 n=1 Tax=Drosophila lebanonensis TaxID=7225 RepID=A0A6J2TSL7_DROLE|nr:transport and Golgi organization protein 2 isoform X2 [Scaptodrosophila lebanonensis]